MKKKHLMVGIICGLLFLLTVHILFSISAPCKWLEAKWGAGDLISFVGTIALGIIAVWQSHEANQMSKKMMQLEQQKMTPQILVSPIRKDEFSTYSQSDFFIVSFDDYHCYFNHKNKKWVSNGIVFRFLIKNMSQCQICELGVLKIETAITDGIERTNIKSHNCSCSIYPNELSRAGKMPLQIVVPEDIFVEVYKSKIDHPSLWFSINFFFKNDSGLTFQQMVDLFIINANLPDLMGPVIWRKEIHPACLFEEEQTNG